MYLKYGDESKSLGCAVPPKWEQRNEGGHAEDLGAREGHLQGCEPVVGKSEEWGRLRLWAFDVCATSTASNTGFSQPQANAICSHFLLSSEHVYTLLKCSVQQIMHHGANHNFRNLHLFARYCLNVKKIK